MTNEEFYDAEIAPKLLELCNLCGDRGMSLVAAVEFAPNMVGETSRLVEGHGVEMRMAYLGIKARGNIDSLVIEVARRAHEVGHSSMILSRIGVPTTPATAHQNSGGMDSVRGEHCEGSK